MKSIILVTLALVAIAVAAPATPAEQQQQPIKIIRSEFEQQAEGGYAYGFETENGITRQETGEVKEVLDEENKPHKVVIARGSYSYTNPDGKLETIEYVADEDGFRPLGDSIPKEPARR